MQAAGDKQQVDAAWTLVASVLEAPVVGLLKILHSSAGSPCIASNLRCWHCAMLGVTVHWLLCQSSCSWYGKVKLRRGHCTAETIGLYRVLAFVARTIPPWHGSRATNSCLMPPVVLGWVLIGWADHCDNCCGMHALLACGAYAHHSQSWRPMFVQQYIGGCMKPSLHCSVSKYIAVARQPA